MKTLLVHPGMPKAGSTSIQSALTNSKTRGSNFNLLDFNFDGANTSLLLASYFSSHRAARFPASLRSSVLRRSEWTSAFESS
jgi:hypothetical protein